MTPAAPSALKRRCSRGVPARRQEDHGDRRRAFVGAQSRHDRRTVQLGHDDIEENKIGPPGDCRRQRLRPGRAIAHREEWIERQRGFYRLPRVGFVIDEENVKMNHRARLARIKCGRIASVARHRSLKSITTMAYVEIRAGTSPHAADLAAGFPLLLTAITSPAARRARSRISSIEAISTRLRPESLARYSA